MLQQFEEDYLQTVSDTDLVAIQPYNPLTRTIAEEIFEGVRKSAPELDARFMGAAALGIAGQNDIDLYLFTKFKDLSTFLSKLTPILGKPAIIAETSLKWVLTRDGLEVEVNVTNPARDEVARQIQVYELLKNNPALLKEYEHVKLQANRLTMREYQRRKFEFYNKILDIANP